MEHLGIVHLNLGSGFVDLMLKKRGIPLKEPRENKCYIYHNPAKTQDYFIDL